MAFVIPAIPPRRRPLEIGLLQDKGSRHLPKHAPKHAWWKCLLSFDEGPPSEKKEGSRSQTPVAPSAHLKWARHCRQSTSRSLGRSYELPKGYGQPAALRPSKPLQKKGEARYAYPVGTGDRDWVQGLRDSDKLESLATNWQEAKQVRRRKECGLRKLHYEQVRWRQNQEKRAMSALAYERSQNIMEEEDDADAFDEEGYISAISQNDPFGAVVDGHCDEKGFANTFGTPRDGSSDSIRPGISRSSSSASVQSSESSEQSAVSQQLRNFEHADIEITQDLLANSAHPVVRPSSRASPDRPHSQAAIDHPHHERAGNLEEEGSDVEEEKKSHVPKFTSTHERLSRQLGLTLGPKLRECSLEPWQEWIAEFPIETLDSLADFYESHRMDFEGARHLSLAQLQTALHGLFGFPANLVVEQIMANGLVSPSQLQKHSGDASGQGALNITFTSLPSFLSLIRDISHRLERTETNLVWSREELKALQAAFKRHANSHGRAPVMLFFDLIQDLGMFSDINLQDKEEQQWLSDVVGKIMMERKTSEHSGTMSFDEFLRIITSAMRDIERAKRQTDFMRERVARKDIGLSALEMEDLRELHRRYAGLELPRDKSPSQVRDPMSRMALLLESCTPNGLSDEDRRRLVQIIKNTGELDRIGLGGLAPFDIFMHWMREAFRQGLGNLPSDSFGNSGPAKEEDLNGRSGFAVAMLHERAREIKRIRQQQIEDGFPSPHKRRHSHSHRESRPASRQDRSFSRQLTVDVARPSSNPNHRRHSGQPEARKRSTSAARRGKVSKSVPSSQAASRRNSYYESEGHKSRELRRATSRCSSVSTSSQKIRNTVHSAGLPTDAMLNNRAYRAPSIDMQGKEISEISQIRPKAYMRKQKTGLDSAEVVQGAISKLEEKVDTLSPLSDTQES